MEMVGIVPFFEYILFWCFLSSLLQKVLAVLKASCHWLLFMYALFNGCDIFDISAAVIK